MIRLGVIAPDLETLDRIPFLAAELGLPPCEIVFSRLAEAVPVARGMEQGGVDVIVCRGATCELLERSRLHTPLVNIPLSINDISIMLANAKALTGLARPRIAVVTYPRIDLDLQGIARILDTDTRLYPSGFTRESLQASARQAVQDKADVVVGGLTTLEALAEYDVKVIPYVSSDSSITQALLEARQIAFARKLEQERALQLKAVVDTAKDGIVVLDSFGRIRLTNDTALQLLGIPRDCANRSLLDLCPPLQAHGNFDGSETLTDELVHVQSSPLLLNLTPIVRQNKGSGAVLHCQPAREIVELEAKIRKKLPEKGLVARYSFADLAGTSPQMAAALAYAKSYAAADDPVLITGETGTGKELVAQGIHLASERRAGPFVAVNCAALPPALLESELFGYEDGAFTGASRKGKAGLFELAHRGTIFLDEISGLDQYGQTRLLRVLQEGNVLRLGGDRYQQIDFRVVTATNEDLLALCANGACRKDFFYRLAVLRITLPPLREREGDVACLAAHFARQCRPGEDPSFSPQALALLQAHDWPGNVRELRQVIKRLCLHCRDRDGFTEDDVMEALDARPTTAVVPPREAAPVREQAERAALARQEVVRALRLCGNKQGEAARMLGIDPSTLYRRMQRLGIRKVAV